MAYDYARAKESGLTDQEISEYLSGKANYNLKGALEAGLSYEEINNHLVDKQNTIPEAPGYMARVKENLTTSMGNIADIGKMIQSDTSRKYKDAFGNETSIGGGIGEKATAASIRLASEAVNIVASPVVEGIVSLWHGVSPLLKDVNTAMKATNPLYKFGTIIKEGATDLSLKAIDTEAGQQGVAALNSGIDTYREWAKTNPNDAKLIGAVINIAPFSRPAKLTTGLSTFNKIAGELDSAAAKQAVENRFLFLQDLTTPKKTAAVETQLKQQSVETGGLLQGQKVIPKADQQGIMDVVYKLPEINSGNTMLGNRNVISTTIKTKARTLINQLEQPIAITRAEIVRATDRAVNLASQIHYPTGNSVEIAENMARKMRELITKQIDLGTMSNSNALLAARKEFDSWAKSFKNDIYEGGATKAEDAARQVRESINELIVSKNPNINVASSLDEQAKLFGALEIIDTKIAGEANNSLGRAWQKISGVPGFRSKLINVVSLATGSGLLGAAAFLSPVISAGLGGALAVTFAGKALSSVQAKTYLSFMLKEVDNTILTSKVARDIIALQLSKKTIEELISTMDMQDQQNPNAVQSQIPSGQPAFLAPLAAPARPPLPGPVAQTSPQDMPFNVMQGTGISQVLRPQEAHRQATTGIGGR